jgi:hypothetical protein
MNEELQSCERETARETTETAAERPYVPEIRPALEPVCCGSGCAGCPWF